MVTAQVPLRAHIAAAAAAAFNLKSMHEILFRFLIFFLLSAYETVAYEGIFQGLFYKY